jgi:large subunit ribosomal protein L22
MSEVMATAKSLRISPRKLGVVAALVRGRSVKDSLIILEHTPRRGAPLLAKVVKSAAANAENNAKLAKDSLEVSAVLVNPGSIIKRFRAGSRGMISPQRHRTSHVTVIISDNADKPAAKMKVAAKTAAKPKGASPAKTSNIETLQGTANTVSKSDADKSAESLGG